MSAPDLQRLLTLDPVGPQHFRSLASQPNRSGTVFGGQLLAQMLCAAQLDGGEARKPHALQATFLRPASVALPLDYLVEPVFDGRTETIRLVRAMQDGQLLASATVSACADLPGWSLCSHWSAPPSPPEQLESVEEAGRRLGERLSPHGRTRLTTLPQVEIRPLDPEEYFLVRCGPPASRIWIRCKGGPTPGNAPAPGSAPVLAFLSDYLASSAALVALADQLPARPLLIASLNHSMWFHDDADPGGWFLLERESHWSGSGRTLGSGRIFRRDGALVASMMQETLIR